MCQRHSGVRKRLLWKLMLSELVKCARLVRIHCTIPEHEPLILRRFNLRIESLIRVAEMVINNYFHSRLLAIITSYSTGASGIIVLLKTLTGNTITLLFLLICKDKLEKTKAFRFSSHTSITTITFVLVHCSEWIKTSKLIHQDSHQFTLPDNLLVKHH